MGCGTSRRVSVDEKAEEQKIPDAESDDVILENELSSTPPLDVANLKRSHSCESGSDKADFGKSSPFLKNSLSDEELPNQPTGTPVVSRKSSYDMNTCSPELQERITALSARRRAKSLTDEDGLPLLNGNHNMNTARRNSSPEMPRNTPPRTRSSFSLSHQSEVPSPFGQRARFTLSDSQQEFFRMLDEKIAQGKDYCSEDEKSISSLVSRRSAGKNSYRRLLTPLHAR